MSHIIMYQNSVRETREVCGKKLLYECKAECHFQQVLFEGSNAYGSWAANISGKEKC